MKRVKGGKKAKALAQQVRKRKNSKQIFEQILVFIRHIEFTQNFYVPFVESFSFMIAFLIFNILINSVYLRMTIGESAVTLLPFKTIWSKQKSLKKVRLLTLVQFRKY